MFCFCFQTFQIRQSGRLFYHIYTTLEKEVFKSDLLHHQNRSI